MELINDLPVESHCEIGWIDGDFKGIPFADRVHVERPISRSLERVNCAGAMDQRVVRSRQFVDLNFESEINSDVSSVVVVLLLGIGKSYKDSGVVVEAPSSSIRAAARSAQATGDSATASPSPCRDEPRKRRGE